MNTISQFFLKTGRISGPEVGDGAKPDVPKTDRQKLITTDKSPSRKIVNSKYDPIDSEMSEMSGRTTEGWHTG